LLEAYVLAGLSEAEVAARCGVAEVTAEVVGTYASLFLDVQDKLEAGTWLKHHVLGATAYDAFANGEVRQFWAWCAMAGGTRIVDYVARTLREVLGPGEEPSLGAYLRPGVPLRLQAFVAITMIPLCSETEDAFHEFCLRERAARTIDDPERSAVERDRLRVETVRLARAIVEGRPLPKRTWLKRQRAKMQKDLRRTPSGKTGLGPDAKPVPAAETLAANAEGSLCGRGA
jgi:hypothetical protein